MKRFIGIKTGILAVLLAGNTQTFAQQTGRKQSFIPKGYRLLTEAAGDLNKDGIPDAALVVENTNPANFQVQEPNALGADTLNLNDRKLLVLFGNGAGNFRKIAENSAFIPSENSDVQSCLADPLMEAGGVQIEKGLLKIDLHYWYSCGSWYVTHNTYTFRWQEGRMRLIGFDVSNFHRASGEETSSSLNFSTARRKDVSGENMFEEAQNPKTTWRMLKSKKPVFLEDLTAESDFADY